MCGEAMESVEMHSMVWLLCTRRERHIADREDLQALHEDVGGRRGEVKVVFEQVRLDAVEDVRRDGVAEVVGDVDGEGAHFRVEELDLVVVEGRGSVLFAIRNAPGEGGRRQHVQKVRAGDVDEHVAPPSVPEALEVLGRKSVPVDGRSRNWSVRSSEKMHRNRG